MIGWIIYSIEDIEKNRKFVEMMEDEFSKYNIQLKTIIIEKDEISRLEMPDFAINRSRKSAVSEMLEDKNIPVFNSAKVTKITNNKYDTYKYLEDVVPVMRYSKVSQEIEYPKVIKTLEGHGGREVFLVEDLSQEREVLTGLNKKEVLYQQCSSDLGRDVRVYIIGNQIVAAVLRTSKESFKSNYSLGGDVSLYTLNEKEKAMVNKILKKLPLDYGGIDFIFHHKEAVFNEIEDAVGARMLYKTSSIDIVSQYVKYIVDKVC